MKGQARAEEGLLLLEGQPERGIKAFISSHSLRVLFQQIFQTEALSGQNEERENAFNLEQKTKRSALWWR